MIGTDTKILVVEDESLLAMLLEDYLADLGFPVPATAATVSQALSILAGGDIGFAILDINLGGEKSFPVAEALDARGIPYIFTTGYGEAGVPERLRHRYVLQKPYGPDALRNALARSGSAAEPETPAPPDLPGESAGNVT